MSGKQRALNEVDIMARLWSNIRQYPGDLYTAFFTDGPGSDDGLMKQLVLETVADRRYCLAALSPGRK